jgi:hypothetical protein
MTYPPAFRRLLGLPEGVTDPGPHELLGLDPAMCGPAAIDDALKERKKVLRQRIPGPQFIPLIVLIEAELDRAAASLLDPTEGTAFGHTSPRNAKPKCEPMRPEKETDRGTPPAFRGEKVTSDGQARTPSGRCGDAGLEEEDIQSIPAATPRGMPEVPPSEARDFFATAVALAIRQRLLARADEANLLTLAEKLGLSRSEAMSSIRETLEREDATLGDPDAEHARRQFAKQVVSLYPSGHLSIGERASLLELAEAQGVPYAIACEVLDNPLTSLP